MFEANIPETSARAPSPSLRQGNEAHDNGTGKFTLDFVGTPGIGRRLGQKGLNNN